MVTSFMIGNDLLFDTSEMVLHHLKDGESIHLSGVKGRCLKCLISHTQQDITTKKQICDEVWGQFGLFASDSTLLQTIYALRRDLRDIEMTDLIVTHPRLGYQINPAYSVTPVAELGAEKMNLLPLRYFPVLLTLIFSVLIMKFRKKPKAKKQTLPLISPCIRRGLF